MSLDVKNSKGVISFLEGLVKPLRKMSLSSEMGNLEIFENLERIDKYLQDEDSVVKLLYLMPNFRGGLGLLFEGLYSNNEEIAHLTAKIIQKLTKCEIGSLAVNSNINMFHQLKLSEILYQDK
jgi:hypothetical protein